MTSYFHLIDEIIYKQEIDRLIILFNEGSALPEEVFKICRYYLSKDKFTYLPRFFDFLGDESVCVLEDYSVDDKAYLLGKIFSLRTEARKILGLVKKQPKCNCDINTNIALALYYITFGYDEEKGLNYLDNTNGFCFRALRNIVEHHDHKFIIELIVETSKLIIHKTIYTELKDILIRPLIINICEFI